MNNIIYYLEAHALGDEIHMHRNVLLSLLEQNLISNDVVIYCLLDRKFLYSKIFKNIFCYEEAGDLEAIKAFCDIKFKKNFLIVKNFDVCFSIWEIWRKNGGFHNTLECNVEITRPNVFGYRKINYFNNNTLSPKFRELVKNIEYLDDIPKFKNQKYIVYHHRVKNDNLWDADDEMLHTMLKYAEKYNLVIFTRMKLEINKPNIYITSNLQEYATYINHTNCLAVISIWSGGGQLASYCSTSKVFMYFHPSQLQHKCDSDQLNVYFESQNAFDFCQFSEADRKFVDIQHFMNNPSLIDACDNGDRPLDLT